MFAIWLRHSGTEGFFLLLFLLLMTLLRWRIPKLRVTVLLDCAVCILVLHIWPHARYALIMILFEGMYRKFYWVGIAGIISLYFIGQPELVFILMLVMGGFCGVVTAQWETEFLQKQTIRDEEAGKYYELENVQSDLLTTLPQIERMTAVAERARIARDIHDNAGHEIVAAYISLQTARGLFEGVDEDALELYDAAMERLSSGVTKIRETAHNLQTVTTLGIESLLETCDKYPGCPVKFKAYGDSSKVPVYVWNMLESCLNESLTNASRHARPSYVTVELDVTSHLVRLSVENDGAYSSGGAMGIGLRNLRHRAVAIGGTFSVDNGMPFRVICVIPIQE